MNRKLALVLGVWLAAGEAAAEPVSSSAAAGMLHDTESIGLQLASGLSKKEHAAVKNLVPLIAQQTQTKAKFFGALAYAPDEGLVSESLQGAFNFHSVAAADQAALKACEAAKKATSGACRLAARILPPGYQKRGLSLSHDASIGFFSRFLPATGTKFLAASQSTGAWAMGPSANGALAACAAKAKNVNDCRIVIEN